MLISQGIKGGWILGHDVIRPRIRAAFSAPFSSCTIKVLTFMYLCKAPPGLWALLGLIEALSRVYWMSGLGSVSVKIVSNY